MKKFLEGLAQDLRNMVDFGTKEEWNKFLKRISRYDNCPPSRADIIQDKIVNAIFYPFQRAYYFLKRVGYRTRA